MSGTGKVVLRRSWPQRFVILCTVGVIAGAFAAAWFLDDVYTSVSSIGRVHVSGEILLTDTEPGAPVNFLLIGTDSAAGLDPSDPAAQFRPPDDPSGNFNADSITILRVNPTSGEAWVLSVPRDLIVEFGGRERKINSVLLVAGPSGLVQVIKSTFGIQINHFMSLDFLGFREVVDELNGVPVWFDRPARDLGSGLDVQTSGCHVFDGVHALQYVRARKYEELFDGEWKKVGNVDFGRIERQQDFLVLALDRAIDRGARDPTSLAALISAGAESLILDDELTVAELIDVGQAFSDFNPENLERFTLSVWTDNDPVYVGERLSPGQNDDTFAVFKGETDLLSPNEISFDLYSQATEPIGISVEQLEALGFTVDRAFTTATGESGDVVLYPPGARREAETIARWLEPIPRLVEDPDATSVSLVLGEDHQQILFYLAHVPAKMRAAVAEYDDETIPDLSASVEVSTATTESTETAPPSTTTTVPSTTTTVTTTTTVPPEDVPPTTTVGIIGRPPEGQSCG